MKKFVFWLTLMCLGFFGFMLVMINIQTLEINYGEVFYFLFFGTLIMFILGLTKTIINVFIEKERS